MTTPRHRRLSEVFLAAAELEGDERTAYLDRACGSDAELRRHVERMLAGEANAPEILEPGALDVEGVAPFDDVPERVGPYRILETLGEGGMGVVYLAEQERPVRRRVALKLIKRGLETKQVLARFDTERQALARMSHPNIAQVLDAGATADGRPFFAMEYVEGLPITEHGERHGLTLRSKLELFGQVCAGVQHAHQKGVIHRDIKPSNVLVARIDERAVPKIIDFGVAKATEAEGDVAEARTSFGQLFGTLPYMSPEQAAGHPQDVDTRCDVYGLGALLYATITGVPPFDFTSAAPDEARRRIREEDPSPPSARPEVRRDRRLARAVRGDLDRIVSCALERDRDRRYASPSELAADVGRYLRGDPIQAGPPNRWYRAAKLARKHRVAVGTVAAILVTLLGFAVALSREARRADRAAARSVDEARRARQELRHAEGVSAFLIQLFEAGALSDADGGCATVCDLVDGALGDLDVLRDQPFLRSRLMLVLGKIVRDSGSIDLGRADLRRALADMDRDPATMHFLEIAGWKTAILRRLDEAELTFERLAEIRERDLGPLDPESLRTRAELGRVFTLQGRLDEAQRRLESVLEAMRRTLGDDHPYTLETIGYSSMVSWRQARLEATGALLEPALGDMVRVLGPEHYITLATLYNLARVEASRGHEARALALLSQAVDSGFIYLGQDDQGRIVQGSPGMRADPFLAPLRNSAEFERILARAL